MKFVVIFLFCCVVTALARPEFLAEDDLQADDHLELNNVAMDRIRRSGESGEKGSKKSKESGESKEDTSNGDESCTEQETSKEQVTSSVSKRSIEDSSSGQGTSEEGDGGNGKSGSGNGGGGLIPFDLNNAVQTIARILGIPEIKSIDDIWLRIRKDPAIKPFADVLAEIQQSLMQLPNASVTDFPKMLLSFGQTISNAVVTIPALPVSLVSRILGLFSAVLRGVVNVMTGSVNIF
ncbi:PREDICTED: uncharacterized protein LOC107188201 isoform X1 [Dufourea novaeangliae]|uniref:uncharacterized protein LOC107188201 isoform X1 n=1 Tax=Dufourea novaeangliae TaxID=178035 RepID=UPI0007675BBA|nr:PREDICTED: uncharacterized protein LOC107188201 isoform X1 [Dufourea novaeangliae]